MRKPAQGKSSGVGRDSAGRKQYSRDSDENSPTDAVRRLSLLKESPWRIDMEANVTSTTTIEQLYEAYHEPLLRYLERLVRQHETAEDLCHESFIKAMRHWDERD